MQSIPSQIYYREKCAKEREDQRKIGRQRKKRQGSWKAKTIISNGSKEKVKTKENKKSEPSNKKTNNRSPNANELKTLKTIYIYIYT